VAFGGVVDARAPRKAMLQIKSAKVTDAFHLSPAAYEKLFDHAFGHYLAEWLVKTSPN
jgi:hypothetical protein